jgi:putative DNA primase/helicase
MSATRHDLSTWSEPGSSDGPDSPEPIDDEVVRLAALPILQYEQTRKDESKRLGVRATALDKAVKAARGSSDDNTFSLPVPEPWSTAVGEEIAQILLNVTRRHLVLPEHADVALALWVLHAHAFESAEVSPNLAITSPEKQCGKSTVLDVLQRLVPKALPTSNATSASIFRAIDQFQPTLLIDEADTFLHGNEELRGILNSSHCRTTANVIRTVGDNHEARLFTTWTPVAIAKIGKLPDTLADRSIPIEMRRKLPHETVERLRRDRTGHLEAAASKAARWAEDHLAALSHADPDLPKELSDRGQDNWRHLIAIADLIGLGDEARKAAVALSGPREATDASVGEMLLGDIQQIFEAQAADRLSSEAVCTALEHMEDRPWAEWRQGKPLSKVQLANRLKGFGVRPATIRLDDDRTAKGYRLEQFQEAFDRYLGPQGVTPSQSPETGANEGIQSVTGILGVTPSEAPNPSSSRDCDGVTPWDGSEPTNQYGEPDPDAWWQHRE